MIYIYIYTYRIKVTSYIRSYILQNVEQTDAKGICI